VVLKLRPVSKSAFTQSNDEFRALLKELRVNKGLTQADMAETLGLPQSYVSKIETGERRMDFVETAAFCDAIGIELAAFAKLFSKRVLRSAMPAQRGNKRGSF
jgi:transcriptional regulator with XRE-family HTH domain